MQTLDGAIEQQWKNIWTLKSHWLPFTLPSVPMTTGQTYTCRCLDIQKEVSGVFVLTYCTVSLTRTGTESASVYSIKYVTMRKKGLSKYKAIKLDHNVNILVTKNYN